MKKIQTTTKTWKDLQDEGYKIVRVSYFRGYISRKIDVSNQPIKISGKGELFFESPNFNSTQYALRVYVGK